MPHQGMSATPVSSTHGSLTRYHHVSLPAERSAVPVETLMNEYEIDKKSELGRGAHGVVLSATHKTTGERCAIKTRPKAGLNQRALRWNRTEGELLTRVFDHINIIKAHEYFETEEKVHLVMELAPDGDLLEIVNKRSGMSELEASLIGLQLIDGLAHAHSHGIVHGDIKLENVWFFFFSDFLQVFFFWISLFFSRFHFQ